MTNVEYTNPNPVPNVIVNTGYTAPINEQAVITEEMENLFFARDAFVGSSSGGNPPDNVTLSLNGSNQMQIKLSNNNVWTGSQAFTTSTEVDSAHTNLVFSCFEAAGAYTGFIVGDDKLWGNGNSILKIQLDMASNYLQFGNGNGNIQAVVTANSVIDDGLGNMLVKGDIHAGYIQLCNSARVYSGSGAPNVGGLLSIQGDIYFRTDTPTIALQRIYICTVAGTTWVGIV